MTKRASLVELVKCRWREFRREPSAFFFVLLMPVLWMVLFGFGLSGDRRERFGIGWPVAASDATLVREGLAQSKDLRLREGSPQDLDQWLKRGDILVIAEPSPTGLVYRYDPANREARRARDLVDAVAQRAAGRLDVLLTEDIEVKVPGTRYVDFLVPGLLALTILSTSLWGTGMTIVANRRENLLKRFMATPMRPYEYILSHVIGRLIILGFEVMTVLLAAGVIFKFRIAGTFAAFATIALLGASALTAMGILLGSRTTNSALMNGICNLILLPMMVLSGVWFGRSNMPEWLADAARWLPLTPVVDGLRRVALEGATLAELGFEVGLLAAYFAAATVAARRAFKWY